MFFIRLPQLAVLAKILCLLMVVMCGAVPSTVRSVSLYSTCNRGNVSVFGRKVNSTMAGESNAPYQKITTQSDDFSMKIYLFAEETKHYICFTKRWKIVGLPKNKKNERCQYKEIYHGRHLRYQSVVDPTRYIGFNKWGRPITTHRGRPECYNFIKINPFNVDFHNELVGSDRGTMKHRSLTLDHNPYRPSSPSSSSSSPSSSPTRANHQHHHQQQHQQPQKKKHALLLPSKLEKSLSSSAVLVPASSTTTTQQQQHHHRHRHNSLKTHEDAATTRRRHRVPGNGRRGGGGQGLGRRHGTLFVEDTANSKY